MKITAILMLVTWMPETAMEVSETVRLTTEYVCINQVSVLQERFDVKVKNTLFETNYKKRENVLLASSN